MVNGLRETIERWILKAEILLKNDIRVFIKDVNDNWYWADILFVGEEKITIQSFKGKLSGIKKTLFWADILKFEEYREKER